MFLTFLSVALLVAFTSAHGPQDPEQVHISLGTNETEMLITWVTIKPLYAGDRAQVFFGLNGNKLENAVHGHAYPFHSHFITYRALLTGLKPETKYFYKVGSARTSYSKLFDFRTLPSGENWLPRVALYGDLGLANDESLPYLSKDVEKDMYDVILHVGDISYDLYEENTKRGSDFMNAIENVAARVPYLTVPGNHEEKDNFSHYDARFSMIGDRHDPRHDQPLAQRLNNHFWTADIGPVHLVMFSSEFYYYTNYGWDQIERQFHFLEQDLKRANDNRSRRPWIIVMGHRPLYCLKIGDSSCDLKNFERPDIRQGIHMHNDRRRPRQYGLEDLFHKYGVDILVYGHEHYYARLLPIYNKVIMNGTDNANPYYNPNGPVHITTGSAGNREEHPPFNTPLPHYVAKHAFDYGYTRMTFEAENHIKVEQVSDDKHGKVIDTFNIIKDHAWPRWMNQV